MHTEFKAHPLLRGGQIQTLAAFFLSSPAPIPPNEFIHVALPDGDSLELLVNHPPVPVKANLYLLHGLGGNSESNYKLRIAKKLLPQGYRIIRHNHRGNGQYGKTVKGMYHSGSAPDVLECLRVLARLWPDVPLGMVGFSLSGTIILNLLGWYAKELEELAVLKAVLTVCAPVDLLASSRALSQVRNKHYDFLFAKTTLQQMCGRHFLTASQIKKHFRRPTLRKIDEHVTAPYGGFQDADDYYERCSPKKILSQISIDTLILAAADDPLVPAQSVLSAGLGPHVKLQMETSGGHMGFMGQELTTYGDYRWLDSFIETWAETKLLGP